MEDSDIDKSQATSIKSPEKEVAESDPNPIGGKEDETLKEVQCLLLNKSKILIFIIF